MTCDDYAAEKNVIAGGYFSPEMLERVKEHEAMCVSCGGIMPDHASLREIFKDMFLRVGHSEVCKGNCKCDDDPPSLFETQVVKQFKKGPQDALPR